MAIAFLDDINLNDNQAQNLVIQRVGTLPGGVEAKVIYDNSSNTIKYYNGTGWVELDGLGGIAGSGTIGTVPTFVTNTTTLGNSALITTGSGATQTFTFNTTGQVTIKGSVSLNKGLLDANGNIGTSGYLLSSTGSETEWVIAPDSYTKWVLTGDTGTQDILDGDTVIVSGGTNITTAVTATDKVTVNLDDDVTLAGELTVSGTGQSSFAGQVTIPGTPVATTDAASKSYVDSSVEGGLTVKGGFNAATGAITTGGNLTVGSSRVAIAIGDYYVVTTAGNFFANAATPLTPGDSVLVQTAAAAGASVEGDFAVIQSDTDLATLTTVGIGNVNKAPTKPLLGINVDYPVATPGTALVGLDIANMDAFAGGSDVLSKSDAIPVYDTTDAWNKKTTVLDITAIGNSNNSEVYTSASGTTHTFTHNLNTRNVIVQLFDTSSFETVYATVVRTSVSVVTVTTAASADITCLITKIG